MGIFASERYFRLQALTRLRSGFFTPEIWPDSKWFLTSDDGTVRIGNTKFNFPTWLSAKTLFQASFVPTLFTRSWALRSPLTVGRRLDFCTCAPFCIFFLILFHKPLAFGDQKQKERGVGEGKVAGAERKCKATGKVRKERNWKIVFAYWRMVWARPEPNRQNRTGQYWREQNKPTNISTYLPVFIGKRGMGNCLLFLISACRQNCHSLGLTNRKLKCFPDYKLSYLRGKVRLLRLPVKNIKIICFRHLKCILFNERQYYIINAMINIFEAISRLTV